MTDRLDELGRELPWDRPDDARTGALRASLLAAVADDRAPATRRRWPIGVAFAGGVAAAAVAAVIAWPRSGADHGSVAVVEASPSAQLEDTTTHTATGDDELVRVHGGRIRIVAGAMRPGDRLRVATGDAEIDGGASYELAVAGDRLSEVEVHSGTAIVRVVGQQPVFLVAGQTWHALVVTADLSLGSVTPPAVVVAKGPNAAVTTAIPVAPPAPPMPTPTHTPIPAPPPPPPNVATEPAITVAPQPAAARATRAKTATESHFQAGWALLRAGKSADAAIELGAAADASDGELASDARYLQAVALIRAGHGAEAERALLAFLDHAAVSVRRGRASVMLGRLIAERGDKTAARKWFESALRDPDPAVVAAANAGIGATR